MNHSLDREFSHLDELKVKRKERRKKRGLEIDFNSMESSNELVFMERWEQKCNIICFR